MGRNPGTGIAGVGHVGPAPNTRSVSLLDQIIDGASDDSVSTSNLLRKVQVVATRMGADDIIMWAKFELNGYPNQEAILPPYRASQRVRVEGLFTGPGGSRARHQLAVPSENWWQAWFELEFRAPLAELEAFVAAEKDPTNEWPPEIVSAYEKTGALSIYLMSLYSASRIIPRQLLRGIIDSIRNATMEFALGLQLASPEAGATGGPTVADAAVANVVNNVTNNIYGHVANIATGTAITQRGEVAAGDFGALVGVAQAAGLDQADAHEFASAVRDERGVDGPKVKGILERVQSGAIKVAGDVTAKVSASILVAAALHFLGTLH